MKKILKIVLIILLWTNGFTAIASGIRTLYRLHYAPWLNDFLLPGILLFILLGIASIVLTFFIKRHPLILAFCALVQGVCLVFALAEQEEIFHRLHLFYQLLAVEGLVLIITAALLMTVGTTAVDTQ